MRIAAAVSAGVEWRVCGPVRDRGARAMDWFIARVWREVGGGCLAGRAGEVAAGFLAFGVERVGRVAVIRIRLVSGRGFFAVSPIQRPLVGGATGKHRFA